jgi:tetratricopeptide (TPR) repeat protein
MALDSLGRSYGAALQLDEARTAFQDAVAVWQHLAGDDPAEARYRYRNAVTLNGLARLLCMKLRDLPEAEKVLGASESLCRRLAEEHPDRPEYWNQLAEALLMTGVARSDRAIDEVQGMLEEALGIREKLVKDYPDAPEYQADLLDACVEIATSYSNARIPGRVRTISKRIRRISEELAAKHPDVPVFVENRYLIEILSAVAVLANSGDHAQITAAADLAVKGAPRSGVVMLYAACCYSLASESALRDPRLKESERGECVRSYRKRAMELLQRAREKDLFDQPWYRAGLRNDPDLEPLRKQADFQRFVRDVEADAAKPR